MNKQVENGLSSIFKVIFVTIYKVTSFGDILQCFNLLTLVK